MATTRDKIEAMVGEMRTLKPDDMPDGGGREFVTGLQMLAGFGYDPFGMLLPADDTELEVFVDNAIRLMLNLRGDDLPPFRLEPEWHSSPDELAEARERSRTVAQTRRRERESAAEGTDG